MRLRDFALLAAILAPGLACGRRGKEPPRAFTVPPSAMKDSGYRVAWADSWFPPSVPRGAKVRARVVFRNAGSEIWHGSVHCVHYFVPAGASLSQGRDPAPRLLLQRPVSPGQTVKLERFVVQAPAAPGSYLLVFDLVNEEVAWFSDRGAGRLTLPVRVE